MNQQQNKTPSAAPRQAPQNPPRQQKAPVKGTAPAASTYGRRKRPNPKLLRVLRGAMYVMAAGIVLTGLLLLILPMFRVRLAKIEVTGNTFYTDEQILAAAGLYEGQELLTVGDDETLRQSIFDWDTNHYIQTVKIRRLFGRIKEIAVSEPQKIMYAEQDGIFYVLDETLEVLHATYDEESLVGFVRVELPASASYAQGKKVSFAYGTPNTAYIGQLISFLDEKGYWDRVTDLDVSKKFSVSYVLDSTCRVELGDVGELDLKLVLVEEILAQKNADMSTRSVVDVSNPQKPTYRALPNGDFLQLHK